jgi:uncharacterized protein (TIGR03118 family)
VTFEGEHANVFAESTPELPPKKERKEIMKRISIHAITIGVVCAVSFFLAEPLVWCATTYVQTNLVSDIPGLAQSTDPNLKNPWGLSFNATSPFWVSNATSNTSTLYQGTGSTINSRVVSVPGGPTGTVVNASTTDFIEANGKPATFLFSTLDGSIYAWNGTNADNVAQQAATVANASFTGLAIANNGSGNFLYAANMLGGNIKVFNGSFAPVTLAGSFTDPNLPAPNGNDAYVPYNIQIINGQLYVEYANFKSGKGAVSIFDTNGNFIKELIAAGGPQLNEPWGVVIAPAGFGSFGGNLLVGNFGNGQINAFDATTGAFVGTVSGPNGPVVNSGLWALAVRTGGTFNTNAVYFTAGINNQADGLFGVLTAAAASTVVITTPTSLTAGRIGTAYSQTLAATGGSAPYSNWTMTNGSLPPGLSLNSATGTISGTPIGVSGTFSFTLNVSDSTGATSTGSFQLNIQPAAIPLPMSRVGSFAQVAAGGGWKSIMTLINLSAGTVNAQVNFFADNGNPLTLPLKFPEFGSTTSGASVNVTLTPNDSIVIESDGFAATGVGWADVQATGALSGYLTFALIGPGGSDSEGTVSLDTRLLPSLLLPYDNTSGFQTGVALANQSGTAQTITVTLIDQNGAQLTTSQINLPAFGHSAFFLSSQFAQSANRLGIIQFQSSGGLTGVGLRFSPTGSFTSIPIIK